MTDQYPSAEYNMSKAAFVLASQNAYNSQEMFFIYSGSLVFFMQAGFSMLEAGSVSRKSTLNILFKNMMDAGIGALSWWLIGYAIAFGDGSSTNGSFAGGTKFGLNDISFTDISTNVAEKKTGEYSMWFFQFTFAATGATIVSGAVAERTALSAYLIYSIFITAFIYPVVVFWGEILRSNTHFVNSNFDQNYFINFFSFF
jgi:Amt family ammonium transporter